MGLRIKKWGQVLQSAPSEKSLCKAILTYIISCLAVSATVFLQYVLSRIAGEMPHFLFALPTVMFIAAIFGVGHGILATIVAALITDYFFILPYGTFIAGTYNELAALIIFVFIGVCISVFSEAFLKSRYRISELEKRNMILEGETRFRLLFENSLDAMLLTIPDGRITEANPAACQMFGMSEEEIIKQGLDGLIDHQDSRHKAILEQRKQNVTVQGEGAYFRKDGTRFVAKIQSVIPQKGNLRSFVILEDITERKWAEIELRESEEKFRLLAENAHAIIGILQGEKIIYANPYSQRASGYSLEELLQIDLANLIHPDYLQPMLERARKRQGGEAVESHYEFVFLTKQHEPKWVDFSPVLISYRGKPAVIAIGFDITDRKKAEEILRENEEHLRMATEAAEIGYWNRDLSKDLFSCSDIYREVFGLANHAQITFSDFLNCLHPDDRERVEKDINRAIGEHVGYSDEYRTICPDNIVRWVLSRGRTEYDETGKPIRMIGIVMNVTERRNYQEQLEKVTAQFENKNKELETIIGIVSHDLRAPLVNVKGFGNEIARDIQSLHPLLSGLPLKEREKTQLETVLYKNLPESLRFIQSSADAMNSLVVTLVEVARAGVVPIKPEKLNMNELLSKIMESIRIKFKAARLSYDIEDLPECFADCTQVSQIFRNLLDNAAKYLDQNRPGQICVGGKLQAGGALYWVTDNGIGISPEDQEKIFEPYYQIKEKAAGGIGLGLVTVKRMVDRNGGKIWVISEKDKFTTFYVTLPLHQTDHRRS